VQLRFLEDKFAQVTGFSRENQRSALPMRPLRTPEFRVSSREIKSQLSARDGFLDRGPVPGFPRRDIDRFRKISEDLISRTPRSRKS